MISSIVRAAAASHPPVKRGGMVDLSGEESNQIFAEMARWEQVLKDTSLAKPPEPPSP